MNEKLYKFIITLSFCFFLISCNEKNKLIGDKNIKNSRNLQKLEYNYAKDDVFVYCAGEKIPSADSKSFNVINQHYSKDNNHVFYCDNYRDGTFYYTVKNTDIEILEGVDPDSFEIINAEYYKDKNHVYRMRKIIQKADPETFFLSGDGYGSDINNVYYRGYFLLDSDGASFRYMGNNYAKDKKHVYYKSLKVDGADVHTFKLSTNGNCDAADKYHKYFKGERCSK